MGPLGPVTLVVVAAVIALLVNLGSPAPRDDATRERRPLDSQETPLPSSTRWGKEWQDTIGEGESAKGLSLAETLLAVASGDLLPTVPGEDVVEEVETLVREGVLATGPDGTFATGGTSGPLFPGEEDVLSGAPIPGRNPAAPEPTDPSPSDPAPSDPAPSDPTPSDPAPEPTDPSPSDPPPSDPPPEPEPTDPSPSDPEPEPSDPPPSDPEPEPEPSDPPPSDPPTSEPEPTDPAPDPSEPPPTEPAP